MTMNDFVHTAFAITLVTLIRQPRSDNLAISVCQGAFEIGVINRILSEVGMLPSDNAIER